VTDQLAASTSVRLEGVYHVLCTPFDTAGELDIDGLKRLTENVIASGVDGLTVLGVMGEAHKLTDAECARVLETVQDVNAGRIPVVVGASQKGTIPAIAASRLALSLGAVAVMVAPPIGAGEALTDHMRRIANDAGVPIVLQDYPAGSGVDMTIPAIAQLIDDVPEIVCVKLESPPTGRRSAALLDRVGDRITILGGLGGLYLADELRHGTHGSMTGMPFPEGLIEICAEWRAGDTERAVELHAQLLPLLVADSQPAIGLSLRKQVWFERGVIACPDIRSPGARLSPLDVAGLRETLAVVGLAPDVPALTTTVQDEC
jgi:4-hydroxy-tetrahydrodipicolinate synthase